MAIIRKSGEKTPSGINVSLPTEKSKPVSTIGGYSILIYGKKKIGKTTLAAQFPDALFLMLEPGAKKLSIYQRSVPDWRHFKGYVQLICAQKNPFQTIVIDPVDILYDHCLRYVCTKLVIQHPSDEAYGKGWDAVKKEFNGEISKLLNSGKGVIFISHMKEEEIEERSGKKYHRRTNTMAGQARGAIEGVVDVWACYDYEGKERTLTILGDDFTDAGHRLNEPPGARFLFSSGRPIREIPMGKTSKEAFENFMKAFNNQLQEGGNLDTVKKTGINLKIKK